MTTICMVGGSDVERGRVWRSGMKTLRSAFEYVGTKTDGEYFHEGVGGNTSGQMLERIADVPVCDIAAVLAGGNDLLKGVPNWKTVKNVQAIVDNLNARGVKVYVMAIPPVGLGADANTAILALNLKLRHNITGATELNLWEAITQCGYFEDRLYVADKVHLTNLAYQVLADYCAPKIL